MEQLGSQVTRPPGVGQDASTRAPQADLTALPENVRDTRQTQPTG